MRKLLVGVGLVLAMVAGAVPFGTPLNPAPAAAEIADYAQDTWGVYDSVTSGTLTDRIDSEVMAIEQIGNVIYVGGKFTNVRQFNGSTPYSQRYLAAFDATTGAWISEFDPVLDGPVYALQASPDGSKLYVGGEFGDVMGVANTQALVALDPTSGDVDTSWKAQLKRNARAVVYTLDLDNTWLYVGGTFSAVGGAEGVPQIAVSRAVKLDLDDATPDTSWTPSISGGAVWGIAVSPDSNTVYLSGYFSSVNQVGGTQGFVGVDNTTGDTIRPGRLSHNNANRPFYLDVVAVNDLVFVAGMEHITWVLDASNNLSVVTRHSTGGRTNATFLLGGDYQDLEVVGDRVYASCHCRGNHYANGDIFRRTSYSREDPIRFVAAYSATNGAYLPQVTFDISGSSGSWAVHGAPDGCLWIGGDITRATRQNGSNQGRGGFVRHCDTSYVVDTVRPSVPSGVTVSVQGDDVSLSWNPSTDNVGVVGYDIFRVSGGQTTEIGSANGTSFVDNDLANGTYSYFIKAVDGAGNVSWRTGYKTVTVGAAADTERPSIPNGISMQVGGDGNDVEMSWNAATDNVGVVGYQVYRATSANGAGTLIATAPGTSYVDSNVANGTYWYYLRAVDAAGNQSWRTGKRQIEISGAVADTERPTPPRGLQASSGGNGQVVLTWTSSTDNVGVTDYVIIDANGTTVATVTATPGGTQSATVSGFQNGATVTLAVRAQDAAGNLGWRSNQATATAG